MASYLWRHGLMEKAEFTAKQGHGLGRPGQARVARVGAPDALEGVRVAGEGFVLMRGTVDLPEAVSVYRNAENGNGECLRPGQGSR
ncbi:hypothetical protein RA26_17360 [Leisingera sp. ANG-M7]|nr:hypothetical protein RA26_17360 [Leisingera sp. ANG-M7]